ncbi:putative RNA-directed DNA polymerase from transposon X-element [Trichonephila clavipes]|nr:putative RNA-directed DNA polymerase from transposon X-element [Trichonephila clavipes]
MHAQSKIQQPQSNYHAVIPSVSYSKVVSGQIKEISHVNTPNSNFSTIFTNVIQIPNDEGVDEELLARAFRAALPALRKLSHPDDKACEIFQAYVALKNGRNNLIIAGDLNAAQKTWNNTRSNFGFHLKRIIQNYPNARIFAPYTPTHINSRSRLGENFRFLLKNKPLPIPASHSNEHLDVAIGRLGENISEALVAASKPKFKTAPIINYLQILAPKFATEIGYGDFGKDLETLLLKMNSVLSATRSPVISDTSPVQDGSIAVAPIEKAEVIADSLQKQFEPNTDLENPRFSAHIQRKVQRFLNSPTCMDLEKTSPSEIQGFIKNIKPNKSPGIDLITNRILKNLPTKFIIFIALLFNMLLESATSKSWRMAVDPHS